MKIGKVLFLNESSQTPELSLYNNSKDNFYYKILIYGYNLVHLGLSSAYSNIILKIIEH